MSQLCLLLTKEALFSGWRESPLLLYEAVEALLLEVPSPFSSSTAGWEGACLLAVSSVFASQSSRAAWLPSRWSAMHSPVKAESLLFFIYFFWGMYVYYVCM